MTEQQQQLSTWTNLNRYPSLFKSVSSIFKSHESLRILSFGCSSGEELETLDRIYFKFSNIHGVDINKEALISARAKSYVNNKVEVYELESFLGSIQRYNLIFALSVLCRWPDTKNKSSIDHLYPFGTFEDAINLLDSRLDIGGYLVVFNANYRFEDTAISSSYQKVPVKHQEDQFVTKFSPEGAIFKGQSGIVFRKICD